MKYGYDHLLGCIDTSRIGYENQFHSLMNAIDHITNQSALSSTGEALKLCMRGWAMAADTIDRCNGLSAPKTRWDYLDESPVWNTESTSDFVEGVMDLKKRLFDEWVKREPRPPAFPSKICYPVTH